MNLRWNINNNIINKPKEETKTPSNKFETIIKLPKRLDTDLKQQTRVIPQTFYDRSKRKYQDFEENSIFFGKKPTNIDNPLKIINRDLNFLSTNRMNLIENENSKNFLLQNEKDLKLFQEKSKNFFIKNLF